MNQHKPERGCFQTKMKKNKGIKLISFVVEEKNEFCSGKK